MSEIPREFEPIEDLNECRSLLKEGAKTVASVILWTKEQSQNTISTHLSLYIEADQIIYVWIPPDLDAKAFSEKIAASPIKDCYFSVSLTRANIFFKARFKGYDSGGLQFQVPEKIFKVQRRKDLRFPLQDGHIIKVQFEDPLFPEKTLERKVLDLSAGGLAFLVDDHEQAVFAVGLTLKDLTFSVRGKSIKCDAEVRHAMALPASARQTGAKVGILFKGIKPGDAQNIAAYVFEETRKYFSKFI